MTRNEILATLRSFQDQIARDYLARIDGIFGSYARGEERQDSDLDVLATFDDGANLLHLVGLARFLEDTFHCKVDVVSRGALRREIEPHVMKDLVAP